MTDVIIESAIRLRDRLLELSKELRRNGPMNNETLRRMDAANCEEAAKMLEKLGTEVTRLRLAIGHHSYRRMSHADLVRIADTWNDGDPAC